MGDTHVCGHVGVIDLGSRRPGVVLDMDSPRPDMVSRSEGVFDLKGLLLCLLGVVPPVRVT